LIRSRPKSRLNGERPSRSTVNSVVKALQSKALLTEKGGYIFKAALNGETLVIGLLPGLLNHERTVHHAIKLGFVPELFINGFVTVDQELTLLPMRPGAAPRLTEGDLPAARQLFQRFCACLTDWGLPGTYALDMITQLALAESGITDAPLSDLASLVQGVQQLHT